jgi:hypothetical protein
MGLVRQSCSTIPYQNRNNNNKKKTTAATTAAKHRVALKMAKGGDELSNLSALMTCN